MSGAIAYVVRADGTTDAHDVDETPYAHNETGSLIVNRADGGTIYAPGQWLRVDLLKRETSE